MADDALLLDTAADQEPGHVHQEDQRDVERVAQPHEPGRLVGGVDVEHSPEMDRLVGDDPDRAAVEASEPGDQVAGPVGLHREEVAVVHDLGDDLAHVVRPPRHRRHDLPQLGDRPVAGVAGGRPGRLLLVVGWEEAQVVPDRGEALLVGVEGGVGHPGDLGVDVGPADLLVGEVLAHRRPHQVRPAQRHRGRPPHHRHEVGEGGDVGGAGRARTEHHRHHGDHAAHRHLLPEQRPGESECRADRLLDAGPGGVEQPHHWDALAHRHVAHPGDLLLADGAHRAAHDGEVVGSDRHPPAVHFPDPGHDPVGCQVAIAERRVHVVGQPAVLDERPLVAQQVEPLPHRQLALTVLTGHPLLAAHRQQLLASLTEPGDQLVPRPHLILGRLGAVAHRPLHSGGRF